MPKSNTEIKLTSAFYRLDIETLNVQPKCKFLLRSMRSVKKNRKGQFKYNTLVKFMVKNKDNNLYCKGARIKSVKNIQRYWNYAHSHSTAYIPNFDNMYTLVQNKVKHLSRTSNNNYPVINIEINYN